MEHILSLALIYTHSFSPSLPELLLVGSALSTQALPSHSAPVKTINENHTCILSTCKLFRQGVHRILLAALLTYARKLLAAISSTTTDVC